uniref:Uncharacterized protein n=1 Tax=candidate division WOR-3 bacterium TaxID=2052148 RepID=A0A7C4UB16_UNCW3
MKKFIVFFLILSPILDLSFIDNLSIFGTKPLFILNALYLFSLNFNPYLSLFISFLSGFIYDIFSPQRFGIHIFVFTTLSYFLILAKNKIYWSSISSLFFILITSFFSRFIIEFPFSFNLKGILNFIFKSLFLGTIYNTFIGFVSIIFIKKKYET